MGRLGRGLVLLLAWLGLGGMASAQKVQLEPSAALQCLTSLASDPEGPGYPFVAFKEGRAGRVKLSLKFTSPEKRPLVRVLELEGGEEFENTVKPYAQQFRLPCHDGSDTPVNLVLEYVFKPDQQKVHQAAPEDEADKVRAKVLKCMKHVSGYEKPLYPRVAERDDIYGHVWARMRFDGPELPPVSEVSGMPKTEILQEAIREWVKGYRLPCLTDVPFRTTIDFIFGSGGDRAGFMPGLTFKKLLPSVKGIRQQSLHFDTTQMTCPFDVELVYFKPIAQNRVLELVSHDPARKPLLDWLAAIELDLPQEHLNSIWGDTVRFEVPCMRLNLEPASK